MSLINKSGVSAWEWQHFKIWSKARNLANCSICECDIKIGSVDKGKLKLSTSKLHSHLASKHIEIVKAQLGKVADKEIAPEQSKVLVQKKLGFGPADLSAGFADGYVDWISQTTKALNTCENGVQEPITQCGLRVIPEGVQTDARAFLKRH